MNIKVYIKTTENNEICEINSEIFLEDTTGYIMIDEGSGDKYAHAQSNYLEKRIYDDQDIIINTLMVKLQKFQKLTNL